MLYIFWIGAVETLRQAARGGDYTTVDQMTRVGFPPDMTADPDGRFTPLMEAVITGQRKVAELLIKRGADVNVGSADSGMSPLRISVSMKHKDLTLLLLKHGAEVNHIEVSKNDRFTPLMSAAGDGSLEIVKILVAYGADTKFRDQNGHDARYLAEVNGYKDVAKFLKHLPK